MEAKWVWLLVGVLVGAGLAYTRHNGTQALMGRVSTQQ